MKKKLEDSIKDKQIYITTNEDISKCGYKKFHIRESGNQQWILEDYDRRYYQAHKEKRRQSTRKWIKNNLEYNRARAREYARIHKAERKRYQKQYQNKNREKCSEARNEYNKKYPEKVFKHNGKRRKMGFNPLNNPIEGIKCDGHHINKDDIIYIPNVIHNAIFHNLKTGKNMKVINSIAYSFI